VGGRLLRHQEQFWLCDADEHVPIRGALSGLKTGVWVVLYIEDVAAPIWNVREAHAASKVTQESGIRQRPHALQFQRFLREIREHFTCAGLVELATPSLVPCPGLEPTLEPYRIAPAGGTDADRPGSAKFFLPTSPEIHLKKAIAEGMTDVFELRSCFRRGEYSPHHRAEFNMLEWYRAFADLEMIVEDLKCLLRQLGQVSEIKETDFATLFAEQFDFKLTPQTTASELRELCRVFNVETATHDTFNDLFHRLLFERLEPKMAAMGPLIVRRFPPSQAALAKLDANGWADRFEFYWQGLEIANAFHEVSDPTEQHARWRMEQQERLRLGTSALPMDEELLEAFRQGMPPAAGIALGVERLYMAIANVKDIGELKWFDEPEELRLR